jgi:hypothetical protein
MRKHHVINNLPVEILTLIFESIKIKELRKLRLICSYWSKLTRDIINSRLNMEKIHIINKKRINAINTNSISRGYCEDYYSIFTNLEIYYTKNKYLLSKLVEDEEIMKFISKRLKADNFMDENSHIKNVRKMTHVEFLDDVENSCNNHKEMIRKIMSSIADSDLKFFMNNYELYSFMLSMGGYPSCIESIPNFENHKEFYESFDAGTIYGIIMVYPDKKTFSLHYQIRGTTL